MAWRQLKDVTPTAPPAPSGVSGGGTRFVRKLKTNEIPSDALIMTEITPEGEKQVTADVDPTITIIDGSGTDIKVPKPVTGKPLVAPPPEMESSMTWIDENGERHTGTPTIPRGVMHPEIQIDGPMSEVTTETFVDVDGTTYKRETWEDGTVLVSKSTDGKIFLHTSDTAVPDSATLVSTVTETKPQAITQQRVRQPDSSLESAVPPLPTPKPVTPPTPNPGVMEKGEQMTMVETEVFVDKDGYIYFEKTFLSTGEVCRYRRGIRETTYEPYYGKIPETAKSRGVTGTDMTLARMEREVAKWKKGKSEYERESEGTLPDIAPFRNENYYVAEQAEEDLNSQIDFVKTLRYEALASVPVGNNFAFSSLGYAKMIESLNEDIETLRAEKKNFESVIEKLQRVYDEWAADGEASNGPIYSRPLPTWNDLRAELAYDPNDPALKMSAAALAAQFNANSSKGLVRPELNGCLRPSMYDTHTTTYGNFDTLSELRQRIIQLQEEVEATENCIKKLQQAIEDLEAMVKEIQTVEDTVTQIVADTSVDELTIS